MKPLLSILLVLFAAGAYAQTTPGLRVTNENTSSIVIEFQPQFRNTSVTGSDGVRYTRYDFASASLEGGRPGFPQIPFLPVLVHMASARYTVEILASDYDDIPNANPATIPTWRRDGAFGVSPAYGAPDPKASTTDLVPAEIARVVDVGESRGLLLGTLRFYPVQVALGRNQVRVYKRIVVRINFATAAAGKPSASAFLSNRFPSNLMGGASAKIQSIAGDSPLAQGVWYRMEIKETGIYKITLDFLSKSGISPSAIGSINSIRIFGNGGEELPEDLNAARPNGLEEISRLVVDNNGNGTLDADDFVLFYGKSTRGWHYSPDEKTFHHYINHYTETSVYFLSFGGGVRGKDMAALPSTNLVGAYAPADFQGKTFVENELDNLVNSGRQWVGNAFDQYTTVNTFTTSLPGFVSTSPMRYRFVFFSRSATVDSFAVQENGQALTAIPTYPIDLSSITDQRAYESPVYEVPKTWSLPGDRSVLRMQFVTLNPAAQGWLDWFEILYRRHFEADGDLLLFTSPDTNATVSYTLSKFSSRSVYVFDVTQHGNVKQVTNLSFDPADASIVRFQAAQTAGTVEEFAAVGPNGFKTPVIVKKVTNSNLHGSTAGAEFVIISPQEFLSEAERLRAYRQSHDQLPSVLVDVDQVFNEFSSGMMDPMAIRDFLKYAQTTWTIKPQYVLLFGAGNFDYKNIKTTQRNWIPPYESLESNIQVVTLASDDYFVFLTPGVERISMAIGRLPVRSLDTARAVVDKIISYETNGSFDSWRNRITYVADDGLTSTGDDGSIHTDQSEQLSEVYTPDSFTKEKIFIVQYPTVNTSTGRTKPTVNQAIIDAINRGSIILNYTGHGNTDQWAHENIFNAASDFPLINNAGKLFFLVAATCDFARYDFPSQVSAGEQLILMPGRGAVAEVTADRVVYSGDNAVLNWTLFQNLLKTDANGKPVRLGDAMWATKQVLNGTNDQKHHLLGDPTMRLAVPQGVVSIDSLNHQSAATLVTAGALSRVVVKGSLRNGSGSQASSLDGRALLEVYDAKRQVLVPEWGNYYYEVNGSLIYRGEVSVHNGAVQGVFPIPKDVSYGNARSRINLYAWSDSSDAAGYTENLSIAGTSSAGIDTTGPSIEIFLQDPSFRQGDIVGPNATLIVEFTDSSGINTSTAGIGHKLEATLDGAQRVIDLTNYYRGNLDTYQSGEVRYPFTNLAEGRHTLSVKAWDIYNNSSSSETYFEVRASSPLGMYNVFNVPNPFTRSTTFTFQRSSSDPIDVEVKIYTVAGRLIQSFVVPSVIDRFVRIPWDGRDRDGSEIANGVYFYRVIARSLDRSSTSEVTGKLAVLR